MKLSESKQSFFRKHFPTPRFLRMPAYGIDFSYRSLRIAELKQTRHGLALTRFAERKIPEGIAYSDDFSRNEEVKKILTDLRKDFRLRFVSVSVPEEKGYLFTTKVIGKNDEQIRSGIEFQLEENVPIVPIEAVFDYTVLSRNAQTGEQTVVVAVYPRSVLESIITLFSSVGLIVEAFYLSADAVAASMVKDGDRDAHIIVNLGERNTGISVVSRGVLQFSSTIAFGGEAFTSAIERQFKVSKEEAVHMKQSEALTTKESMQVLFSVANPASVLKDEIVKVMSYWDSHGGNMLQSHVKKVILCGNDADIPGFSDYLALGLRIPVEAGDVWTNIFNFDQHIPQIHANEALSYASAIGLARKCLVS